MQQGDGHAAGTDSVLVVGILPDLFAGKVDLFDLLVGVRESEGIDASGIQGEMVLVSRRNGDLFKGVLDRCSLGVLDELLPRVGPAVRSVQGDWRTGLIPVGEQLHLNVCGTLVPAVVIVVPDFLDGYACLVRAIDPAIRVHVLNGMIEFFPVHGILVVLVVPGLAVVLEFLRVIVIDTCQIHDAEAVQVRLILRNRNGDFTGAGIR